MSANPLPLSSEDFLRHMPALESFARSLVGQEQAEDLVADTLLRAVEKPPAHRKNLGSWLKTMMRNLHTDAAIRETRRRMREGRVGRQTRDKLRYLPASPDKLVMKAEAASQISEALVSLEEPYRHVLLLHFFEHKAIREIAREFACPEATISTYLRRGKERVKKILKHRYGGSGLAPCFLLLGEASIPPLTISSAALSRAAAFLLSLPGFALLGLAAIWLAFFQPWASAPSMLVESSSDGISLVGIDPGVETILPSVQSSATRNLAETPGVPPVSFSLTGERGLSTAGSVSLLGNGERINIKVTRGEARQIPLDPRYLGLTPLLIHGNNHLAEAIEWDFQPGSNRIVFADREVLAGRLEFRGDTPLEVTFLRFDLDQHSSSVQAFLDGPVFDALNVKEQGWVRRTLSSALALVEPDGSFRLFGLNAQSSGRLSYNHRGYQLLSISDDGEPGVLSVGPGDRHLGTLVIREHPKLRGLLLNAAGEVEDSVETITVVPVDDREIEYVDDLFNSYDLATGEFRVHFKELPAGRLKLFAHIKSANTFDGNKIEILLPEVPENGDFGVVRLPDSMPISLRVVSATGDGLSGVEVFARVGEHLIGSTDEMGNLEAVVPENLTEVYLWHPHFMAKVIPVAELATGMEHLMLPAFGLELDLKNQFVIPQQYLDSGIQPTFFVEVRCHEGLFGRALSSHEVKQLALHWNVLGGDDDGSDYQWISAGGGSDDVLTILGLRPQGLVMVRVRYQGIDVFSRDFVPGDFQSLLKVAVTATLPPLVTCKGRVVNSVGEGLEGADVLYQSPEGELRKVQSGANGRFEIVVPEIIGTMVQAKMKNWVPSPKVPLPQAEAHDNFTLQLDVGLELQFLFDGIPQPVPKLVTCQVQSMPSHLSDGKIGSRLHFRPNEDGSLNLSGLPSGQLKITLLFQGWRFELNHDAANPVVHVALPPLGTLEISEKLDKLRPQSLSIESKEEGWVENVLLWNTKHRSYLRSLPLPEGEYLTSINFLPDERADAPLKPLVQVLEINANQKMTITIE